MKSHLIFSSIFLIMLSFESFISDRKVKYLKVKIESSMKMPTMVAITGILLVSGLVAGLPVIQLSHAQYGGGAQVGGSTLEEQLTLAKEKVSNAEQQGAYGSGTPMLGQNVDQTAVFLGVMVAIFGGVAAAFFAMGRSKKAVGTSS